MALTDIELCSKALIRLGAKPITSFTEGSAEAEIAGALYETCKFALLSSYPWSFATKQSNLTESSEEPIDGYSHAFDLPADFLRSISIGNAHEKASKFYMVNGLLNSNQSEVLLTYIYTQSEDNFPPFFDAALILKLAAEFSIPVTESTSRTETLYKLADQEIAKVRLIDAQQDTPNRLRHFNLIDVRG
ncbi:MAG: hypothetical protein AAF988_08035 [Pseudomonadota bacterium]